MSANTIFVRIVFVVLGLMSIGLTASAAENETDREKYQNASLQPLNAGAYGDGPNPENLTRGPIEDSDISVFIYGKNRIPR